MGEEQKTVMLNEGRELEVGLVSSADEFLHTLLGGSPVRAGWTTLRVVKNAVGQPFIAVIIGNKHVGFLAQAVTPELLPALAACEEQGALPQAKGLVKAPTEDGGRPRVMVSLAEAAQVLPPVEAPPAVEQTAASVESPAPAVEQPMEPLNQVEPQAAPAAALATEPPQSASADEQQLLDRPEADQAPEYCPNCGSPHPAGTSFCPCGYSPYGVLRVSGAKLVGTSPMVLPDGCVKCGVPTPEGPRTRVKLYHYPMWIWATLVVGVIPFLVLYFVLRKPLDVSYCLCDKCSNRRGLKKGIAISAWVLLLAAVALAVVSGAAMLSIVAVAVLFVAALVASVIVSAPVRVAGYDDRYFAVAGACPEFLAAVGETVH